MSGARASGVGQRLSGQGQVGQGQVRQGQARQGGGGKEQKNGDQQRFSSSSKLLQFFPRAIATFTGSPSRNLFRRGQKG